MFFVLSNETYYSAYVEGGDTDEEKFAQLSTMRSTLMENLDKGNGEVSLGYDVANTISTPMLVNDWRDPHRSMLVIVGPEKPIDQTEARAIHNFVTESGGKVIVAAENSNANELASLFGVTFLTTLYMMRINISLSTTMMVSLILHHGGTYGPLLQ